MSKFKGTSGPWFLDQYGNLKAEQGDCALSMVGFSGLCLTNGRAAKANTQLVAAAPELLEALMEIINEGGKFVMTADSHRKARSAIAKALGEDAT